jgi:hypothetical protein
VSEDFYFVRNKLPMSTEPAITGEPKHPVHALTTYELSAWRRELEHAIKGLSPDAPSRDDLRRKLDEVLAEQEERLRIRQANSQ